jgi:hypothetical protein
MARYLVNEGDVVRVTAEAELPPLWTCGTDWLVVDATCEPDALRQSKLYDDRRHPDQDELETLHRMIRENELSDDPDALNARDLLFGDI